MTHRERFMAAVHGKPVDRVPVFPLLMFFAAGRAGLSYREFATNGGALAQAQLALQAQYGLDAITACSDAFRLSAELGGAMSFPEDKPPYLQHPLVAQPSDIDALGHPDPTAGRLGDRVRAVGEMAKASAGRFAVLGWVEMPFAEACNLCGVSDFMMLMVDDPDTAHRLLARLTAMEIDFAKAQIAAGADMIGAGDAAASLVSPEMYAEFALPYEQQVCAAIHAANSLVKLHVCGDTRALLSQMATCGADLFNVDHLVPLAQAKAVYAAAGKCCKGNLDPVAQMMQAAPEECAAHALRCLAEAGDAPYMLSPGCEVPAETSDDVFRRFCEAPMLYVTS
ncbi:MAG: uroporphyrinogen decarboxylase family protein [Armatimonadota bacterium]